MKTIFNTAFFSIAASFSISGISAEVVDLETRNTTIRLLIEEPSNFSAVIAVFMGGDGVVAISDSGEIGTGKNNFAVKSRKIFQERGIATVVVSSPNDMGWKLTLFRGSDDYAMDFGNLMAYLHNRYKKPVWVHGTSRGTISIALPATKIDTPSRLPDGIILSSPVTRSISSTNNHRATDNVLQGNLEKIKSPVMIVSNSKDACQVTPPSDTSLIKDALKSASVVKLKIFEGVDGKERGDVCGARHHHGFVGIQKKVVNAMVEFINDPK